MSPAGLRYSSILDPRYFCQSAVANSWCCGHFVCARLQPLKLVPLSCVSEMQAGLPGSGAAAGLHRGRLPTGVAPAAAAAHRCKVQRPSAVRRARRGRLHCAKGGSIVPTDMALSTAASLCRRCLVGVLQQPTAVARSAVRLAGEQRQLQRAVCME